MYDNKLKSKRVLSNSLITLNAISDMWQKKCANQVVLAFAIQ